MRVSMIRRTVRKSDGNICKGWVRMRRSGVEISTLQNLKITGPTTTPMREITRIDDFKED